MFNLVMYTLIAVFVMIVGSLIIDQYTPGPHGLNKMETRVLCDRLGYIFDPAKTVTPAPDSACAWARS